MRKDKMNIQYLAFCGLILSASFSTFADDTNTQIANTSDELTPVEVSAMRFSDSLYESPVNATNISAEQISDSNLSSTSQVLNRYSDVFIRNTGGGTFMGQPSMRGFGVNSQSRVLVLLDGQRLNNIDMRGINWGQIQVNDIDNIEVLYGAQTATYGNYAESGVIKITTKKWGKNGGTFGATYGEYGEYSFYGTVNYSTEDYYASVSANYFHDSGFFEDSLNWNKSVTISAGAKLDTKNELGLYINFGNMFISWPGYITAGTAAELKDLYPNNLTKTEEHSVDYITASLSWENNTAFGEGSAHLGLNIKDNSVFNDYVKSYGYSYTSEPTLYTLSFDPKYRIYLGEEDESYAEGGVDFTYDHLSISRSPYTNWGTYYKTLHSKIDRFTVAPWVAGKAQLNDTFSINASGRYEAVVNDMTSNYDSLSDDELVNGFAGQLGLNAKINEQWNVYVRFDQIYHYPLVDERFSLHGWGPQYNNSNLDPEHGQNYEIGTNFSKDGFVFNTSLFYMHLNDEIAYDGTTFANKNIGDTNRYGAQFRLGYDYEKKVGAFTSWTFVDAEYDSGPYKNKTVAMVPDIMSKSGLWVKPIDYFMVELNFIWNSSQYKENYADLGNVSTDKIPESYSLDLTVNIYPCEHARLFFAVSNLTNHMNCSYASTYLDWQTGGALTSWYVDPGRTLRCGIEIKF
ncbi:MAG: TonB-dependent receptor [Opitutales bacterium]|nr:TonB-dependent receptor [Opitutales bacterium]